MSEHGRIIGVTEKPLGSTLVGDTPAGATSLTVVDAAEFDDQTSGWLSINDQVIAYSAVNDDTGVITLKSGSTLSAAADEGDKVLLYDPLYNAVAVDKRAQVVLDGADDNSDAIDAGIALHLVNKLDTGLRGDTGESVILEDDAGEWKIIDVLGLGSSVSAGNQFEDEDTFTAAADGDQMFVLSRPPRKGSVHMTIGGVPQPHTEFTVDYSTGVVTIPDDLGLFEAGDVFDFRYAYLVGVQAVPISGGESVPFGSGGWDYQTNANSDAAWPSTWNTGGAAPFGSPVGTASPLGWPAPVTSWSGVSGIWLRRTVSGSGPAVVAVRGDDTASVWWNGVQVLDSNDTNASQDTVAIPTSLLQDTNVVMVHVTNFSGSSYADVEVTRG